MDVRNLTSRPPNKSKEPYTSMISRRTTKGKSIN